MTKKSVQLETARLSVGFATCFALSVSACGSDPGTRPLARSMDGGAEGDDGVRAGAIPQERDASVDGTTAARCRADDDRYVFVTRDKLVGTFASGKGDGGAWRVADEFCQQQARAEHSCLQNRSWRAWLSMEGVGSADSHVLLTLYPGRLVRQAEDGPLTIAESANVLFQGRELAHAFGPNATVAWTGTRHDTTASIACSNWTGGDATYRSPGAVVGDPSSTLRGAWTETGSYRPCTEAHPIYCFEVR